MAKKKTRNYLWQSVIGLGFLSGVWTAIGIDPEEVLLNAIGTTVEMVWPNEMVWTLFVLLPTLLLLISVYGAYRKGRILGLAAVIVAYLAGLSILVSAGTAIVLLLAAIVLGILATNRKTARRLGIH